MRMAGRCADGASRGLFARGPLADRGNSEDSPDLPRSGEQRRLPRRNFAQPQAVRGAGLVAADQRSAVGCSAWVASAGRLLSFVSLCRPVLHVCCVVFVFARAWISAEPSGWGSGALRTRRLSLSMSDRTQNDTEMLPSRICLSDSLRTVDVVRNARRRTRRVTVRP